VQYGPTTAYGSTVPTAPAMIASGEAPVAVSAALSGLAPGTAIHYRVVATNAFGTTPRPDQTFTTLAALPPNTPAGLVPSVAGASESNRVWREGNRRATFARKEAPVGTTFSFQGRISASRKLPPGRYTLVITANASGRSAHPVTLSFTIVKK